MRSPDATDGAAAAELAVDYRELSRLVAALRSLAAEMHDRNGSLQAGIDDPDLHEALRHAERDWGRQRSTLKNFLNNTAQALDHVAQAYREVDTQVASAARPALPGAVRRQDGGIRQNAAHQGGPHHQGGGHHAGAAV
jgi:uncharacterized protein YukE